MNTIHRKYKSTKKEVNIIQLKFRLYIQPTQRFSNFSKIEYLIHKPKKERNNLTVQNYVLMDYMASICCMQMDHDMLVIRLIFLRIVIAFLRIYLKKMVKSVLNSVKFMSYLHIILNSSHDGSFGLNDDKLFVATASPFVSVLRSNP